ncbi:MAG TPA: NAD(P)/FAD-dependent oxidoreductase [Deltaproteobacteria bacterium]|nr:NAD(P)/FAD-dependent oxidoreductase [Deltaproteobacteria bacterium]
MQKRESCDAVVVGAGPNGLAAAIELSTKYKSVVLVEADDTIGGGMRSAELTLPHFIHDICAAVLPLTIASPFFRRLNLDRHGLSWIQPEIPLAHPYEDGSALYLHRSLAITADTLGLDGTAYKGILTPFVENHKKLLSNILAPLHFPADPFLMARFAMQALQSAKHFAYTKFQKHQTRALFAGMAAHAMIPLDKPATAAFGIILALLAHAVGWPVIRGGSQKLADALADSFRDNGGEIITGKRIMSMKELPQARFYFFDLTPRQLLNIADLDLSPAYRNKLSRFRYGPGICKVDWALKEPIPWKAPVCRKAGTVHLGNSFEEIDASVRHAGMGHVHASPYIVLAQQSLFDPTRAPEGRHTAWAYCHVPHGSEENVADLMENKIERYAPGFREIIMAKSVMTAMDMERHNPNYVGGDINGGLQDIMQLYTRPVISAVPYRTSQKNIFICSSSTPPGGGVHGLCGYYAAQAVCRG